ncbi:ATPase domain protein, prokaryote domain protein [Candidatus Magnetomorum sp. HK-1]|nr:ATPase domain protein, prokaryote domain protein [Candidatus Magnetomorum sp. HK-1]
MKNQQVIKTLVPDEIYTDRQEFINYFYDAALKSVTRRTKSMVLLGQRRMGKTEIFKRVINKLFFEQDHTSPQAVIPIFYSFDDDITDQWEFSIQYLETFIRWYTAFKLQDVNILKHPRHYSQLLKIIKKQIHITDGFFIALDLMDAILKKGVVSPQKHAVMLPREVSDCDDSTIVMFLDEFQNIHLPQHNFRIVGSMQEAVESPTCPHFVTGSAMTILSHEILGRGSLFGRFRSKPIKPFTEYFASELAIRSAAFYNAQIPLEMAPVIANRCGGNPFYIDAVVHQAAEQKENLTTEKAINKIMAVDVSSGFIWGELHDQVMRWINRINDVGITKWVLYLSATCEGDKIEPELIKKQLFKKEGKDVSVDKIKDVLVKLSRGDLLEYMEFGGWFKKIDDPILIDFLKIWGKTEVEGFEKTSVTSKLVKDYTSLKKKITEHIAYIAEIYMSQVLWNGQRKTFKGRYFHSDVDVTLPNGFIFIKHRVRLGASSEQEIDVYASAGFEFWVCESKYWNGKKVGSKQVKNLITLAEKVKEFEGNEYFVGEDPVKLFLWLYAHDGLTGPALKLVKQHGILWSDKNDLDALIKEVGLRKLSDI